MDTYRAIGLMSGTSLDGLDIAYCKFRYEKKKWKFSIEEATTLKYTNEWLKRLGGAHNLSALSLLQLDNEYGTYLGNAVKQFAKDQHISKIDFVASHGHTIFHQPEKHFTFQLGKGTAIASAYRLPVINDFRSLDVALGGQGAPLVPIGDRLLFSEYAFCLNLGGIANISYEHKEKRIAFDICPVNIVLNHLAKALNMEFDKDGKVAKRGKVDEKLLKQLNALNYYSNSAPKSIGREWVEEEFLPLIDNSKISIENKLATVVEHIAIQITEVCKGKKGKMLVTGGGAFNKYLIDRIKKLSGGVKVIVPDKQLVNYKEALVFAFLGVLRWRGEVNVLKSVTGASKNNSGGSIHSV